MCFVVGPNCTIWNADLDATAPIRLKLISLNIGLLCPLRSGFRELDNVYIVFLTRVSTAILARDIDIEILTVCLSVRLSRSAIVSK